MAVSSPFPTGAGRDIGFTSPGANVSGSNAPLPIGGSQTVGSSQQTNPLLPTFPQGQNVSAFPANAVSSVGGTPSPVLPFNPPQVTAGGLEGANYPPGVANALSQFLNSGAGYNPDVAKQLIASLGPYISQSMAQLQEQFGAGGTAGGSAEALAMSNFMSQVNLNEGQIIAGLYENAVQNYSSILAGAKTPVQPGKLGQIGALLGGLSGASGVLGLVQAIKSIAGIGGGATAAGTDLGSSIGDISGDLGSTAGTSIGDVTGGLATLPDAGAGGAAAALGLPSGIPAATEGADISALGGLDALPGFGGTSADIGGLTEGAISGVTDATTGASATAAGADVGSAGAAVGSGLLSAITGLGIGAGLGALAYELISNIGPSANNIPAAQWNQQILGAGDDIFAALKAGQITQADAEKAIQQLINTAKAGNYSPDYPTQFSVSGTKQGQDAMKNAVTNLQSLLSASGGYTGGQGTLAGAEGSFLPSTTPGWYPGSLKTGSDIASSLLSQDFPSADPSNDFLMDWATQGGTLA